MNKKKICLLGSFAVGKTSLVRQFVENIFSDRYLTTVGVKIDKKIVSVKDQTIQLMVWDLAGDDEFVSVNMTYLRGASGYFLVIDGMRLTTLDTALMLHQKAQTVAGEVPCLVLVNKADLIENWEVQKEHLLALEQNGLNIIQTSAKTGINVEKAFETLCIKMLEI